MRMDFPALDITRAAHNERLELTRISLQLVKHLPDVVFDAHLSSLSGLADRIKPTIVRCGVCRVVPLWLCRGARAADPRSRGGCGRAGVASPWPRGLGAVLHSAGQCSR